MPGLRRGPGRANQPEEEGTRDVRCDGRKRPLLLQLLRMGGEVRRGRGRAVEPAAPSGDGALSELGFPTLHDEEWRFTNLASLLKVPFEPGEEEFRLQRSALPAGVLVCSLAEAMGRYPNFVEPHLARYADWENNTFTALNTAFLRDGAFVYVPAGKIVEEPIYLPFIAAESATPLVWHRRCLIVMGPDSQARIVESYDGAERVYFTNAVTEVVVARNSVLDHYCLQRESKKAFHMATVQVHQDQGSRFTSHSFALGGAIARTNLNVVLDAEACEATLNGLYLASGDQLIDNHTRIDHVRPRCTSHELYKGILDGRARCLQWQDPGVSRCPEDRRPADQQDAAPLRRRHDRRQAAAGDLR